MNDASMPISTDPATGTARGRLKIFLGMCAGVGKTYAMLEAGRVRRKEGVDVVIGVVETHGRVETAQLTRGHEALPQATREHRGIALSEFDIDGCLARRPELVLLDELAHTNAPGSRHEKRWQDAQELLAHGISVYSTLNIQHIDSLNDVVAQITGVTVRETVPDTFIDAAAEIELVDLNPEELLKRLAEGRVYANEQARLAADNFFRPANLVAMREVALRYVAERVDLEVQAVRRDETSGRSGAPPLWPVRERLVVCVTASPQSARLVRATRRLAVRLGAEWFAVHVRTRPDALSPEDEDRLHRILRMAEELGARTATLSGMNVAHELLSFARAQNATKIVLGKTGRSLWRRLLGGTLANEIETGTGEVDLYILAGEGAPATETRRIPRPRTGPIDVLIAVLAVALCTGVCKLLSSKFGVSEINVALTYLAMGAVVGLRGKRSAAIIASVLGVATFNFFFVPPYLSFAVHDLRFLPTFVVMLLFALLTSNLTVQIRRQELAARRREARSAALHELTRDLADAPDEDKIASAALKHLKSAFGAKAAVLFPDSAGALERAFGDLDLVGDDRERAAAQWVFENGRRAGPTTGTLPSALSLFLPLAGGGPTLGVLALRPSSLKRLEDVDEKNLLETFIRQTAPAIERARLTEEAASHRLAIETERLRSALLSSVSHDFRTPLASILGASTSLLSQMDKMPLEAQREIIGSIRDEAQRLNRLVRNLLDMTRLESGAVQLKREWQALEEVVGAALHQLRRPLASRKVDVALPDDLGFLKVDGALMEQVFVNLLENALAYTPDGTPIDIVAERTPTCVRIDVRDRGPGVPEEHRTAVFRAFERGGRTEGAGVGLGLAICDVITRAHGGRIAALPRDGGGAIFRIELPCEGAPPTIEAEPERMGEG